MRAAFLGRQALVLENLALRQQLAVLKRKRPQPRTTEAAHRFWLFLRAVHDGWRLPAPRHAGEPPARRISPGARALIDVNR